MADAPAAPTSVPPDPAPNPIAVAKAAAVAAITKKPDAPAAPAASPPDKSITEIAKLSAKVRELEKPANELKEARDAYAKDPKAGLAKFLGVTDVDPELVKLSAAYFGAAPGTEEQAEAKDDLETKVAALEAKAKADEEARKSAEEKAKSEELTAKQAAARDATYKILDGFVDADGVPEFPYSAVNKEEANGHVVRTANEIAAARKMDLAATPDEEVVALLREANALVEAEYAEIASKYAAVVPKSKKDATVPKTTEAKPSDDKVTSAPVRTAVGNVARPQAATIANKTHVSIREAKDELKKRLASARRN
jgi:hypothetical protein